MHDSVNRLRVGCKALKRIIEATVPPGPHREEAIAMLRTIYRDGSEAIRSQEPRLCWDSGVSTKSPTVRGTFVTADHVMNLVLAGWDNSDILKTHPELTEEDVAACVDFCNRETLAA